MNAKKRVVVVALVIAAGLGVVSYLVTGDGEGSPSGMPAPEISSRSEPRIVAPATNVLESGAADFSDYPLVEGLLDPAGSVERDLAIVAGIFDGWLSNFPAEGNPVGENVEITAALLGQNRYKLDLIPVNHPAINRAGEFCDRWGTPLFFHQLSGTEMEIRSAGSDGIHHTDDDVVWTP